MDGASCPDKSNQRGEVRCKIPCKKTSKDVMVIRVRPPSDQDFLAGWVTPAHQDVQVSGCNLVPAVITMRYEDARVALNKLVRSQYFAAATLPGGGGGGSAASWSWLLIANNPTLAAKLGTTANTADGRAAVADLYRIASEASKTPDFNSGKLSPEERKEYDALIQWQVLSKNMLLAAKLRSTLPPEHWNNYEFELTSDLSVYRENLDTAERLLKSLPSKTPEQLKLFDDVKTLKALPTTGKEAAPAAAIIDTWK